MSEAKLIDDGGPAFPLADSAMLNQGMAIRDWFAGQALSGLLASGEFFDRELWPDHAVQAYEVADCMINQRAAAEPKDTPP